MATNNKITTTELDFDNIKSNLKSFLRGQSTLSDYDFDGSGLSVLLDVLAYNTHYNALYTNLAVNESFLDSAVKRESVVSRAFELGYLPRSATTSKAKVNIKINDAVPSNLPILNAFTPFFTKVGNTPYTFYNDIPYTPVNSSGVYSYIGVSLFEGTPLTQSYVVSDGAKYLVSNANCDISTLTVAVIDNANSSNVTKFKRVDDILSVTANDSVYFIKEIENGLYEIQFGNDRIGKSVKTDNIVKLSYFVTNKAAANGARLFTSDAEGQYIITVVQPSSGGFEQESIDDIKHNSPRLFSASNRAVTGEDYKAILLTKFPNIGSIQVWGGDENIPPVYGKVFISIVPKSSSILTLSEQSIIKEEILRTRKVVTITPEFVDPIFLNIKLNTAIYYDPNATTQKANSLIIQVKNNILQYNDAHLKGFDSIFRYSKLMAIIDDTDPAITSNISLLTVYRTIMPKFGVISRYKFSIGNPIYSAGVPEDSVMSTGFKVHGDTNVQYIKDDGLGNLYRYYLDANNTVILTNNAQGTVNYSTGEIDIIALNITEISEGEDIIFNIKLQSNDIISVREHVIRIDPSLLTVSAIAETSSTRSFTPSR